MRKILSAVLALSLMTSMAAATTWKLGEHTIDMTTGASGDYDDNIALSPSDKLRIYPEHFVENQDGDLTANDFDSDYFSITTKRITTGATYIDSISINDSEGCIEITFNGDYETALNGKRDIEIDELEVKAKKTVNEDEDNEIKKNATFMVCENLSIDLGYREVDPYPLNEDMDLDSDDLGKIICYDKDAGSDGVSYGTMSVELGDVAYLEGRVYDGDEVYYDYDEDADTDILKAYPDAEISFVNIYTNGFPTAMDLELYANEDEYVYGIKDGKVVDAGLDWDEDVYAYTGKIRSSASYIISDVELDVSDVDDTTDDTTDGTDTDGTENPDTGANDVVGIASALAVVSLIAAGAVAVKK